MIVLLAHRWDPAARSLAQRWSSHHSAAVLTARDLATPGWRQRLANSQHDTIVLNGQPIPQSELTAVLTLTPCIFEQELLEIAPADRAYVASEMTSFLLAWLSRLPCPVLNRPTPSSLAGPYWRRERWIHAAAQHNIPVEPHRRLATPGPQPPEPPLPTASTTLTVLGDQVLGEAHPTLHRHARTLARFANAALLAIHFSSPGQDALFLNADTFPNFADPEIADAALAYLQPLQAAHA